MCDVPYDPGELLPCRFVARIPLETHEEARWVQAAIACLRQESLWTTRHDTLHDAVYDASMPDAEGPPAAPPRLPEDPASAALGAACYAQLQQAEGDPDHAYNLQAFAVQPRSDGHAVELRQDEACGDPLTAAHLIAGIVQHLRLAPIGFTAAIAVPDEVSVPPFAAYWCTAEGVHACTPGEWLEAQVRAYQETLAPPADDCGATAGPA